MARSVTSAAWQSAYELGCLLQVCSQTAQRDLPDHARLLATSANRLGPTLPATDEGLDFGEVAKSLLFNSDQPDTLVALWALLLSDALQHGIVLDLMDLDLTRLPDVTRCLGQARRSAILRAAHVYQKRQQREGTLGLTRHDRLSLPPEAVIAPLADLARTATEKDIRAIAVADLGAY
jgi:hypothetical protein